MKRQIYLLSGSLLFLLLAGCSGKNDKTVDCQKNFTPECEQELSSEHIKTNPILRASLASAGCAQGNLQACEALDKVAVAHQSQRENIRDLGEMNDGDLVSDFCNVNSSEYSQCVAFLDSLTGFSGDLKLIKPLIMQSGSYSTTRPLNRELTCDEGNLLDCVPLLLDTQRVSGDDGVEFSVKSKMCYSENGADPTCVEYKNSNSKAITLNEALGSELDKVSSDSDWAKELIDFPMNLLQNPIDLFEQESAQKVLAPIDEHLFQNLSLSQGEKESLRRSVAQVFNLANKLQKNNESELNSAYQQSTQVEQVPVQVEPASIQIEKVLAQVKQNPTQEQTVMTQTRDYEARPKEQVVQKQGLTAEEKLATQQFGNKLMKRRLDENVNILYSSIEEGKQKATLALQEKQKQRRQELENREKALLLMHEANKGEVQTQSQLHQQSSNLQSQSNVKSQQALENNCYQGNVEVCYALVNRHVDGKIANVDLSKARTIYNGICEAAKKGGSKYQYYCARLNIEGKVDKPNIDEATRLFSQSCQHGFVKACESLDILKQLQINRFH